MARSEDKRKKDDKQKATPPSRKTRISTKARQKRHERNISKAAERRTYETYTIPSNAVVELSSLPAKARDKAVAALPEEIHVNEDFTMGADHEPIMVPNPRRGLKLKGRELAQAVARREEQARRINTKAEQRRRFATLSPREKAHHRDCGRRHVAP